MRVVLPNPNILYLYSEKVKLNENEKRQMLFHNQLLNRVTTTHVHCPILNVKIFKRKTSLTRSRGKMHMTMWMWLSHCRMFAKCDKKKRREKKMLKIHFFSLARKNFELLLGCCRILQFYFHLGKPSKLLISYIGKFLSLIQLIMPQFTCLNSHINPACSISDFSSSITIIIKT